MIQRVLFLFALFAFACSSNGNAADYYVDSVNGNDGAAGTSPETAWRSLKKASEVKLAPGDALRFRRGSLWRETLACQNGEPGKPITYGAYGEGQKPVFLASVDLSSEESWVPVESSGGKIWKTRPDRLVSETPVENFARGAWRLWTERGAKASIRQADFDGRKGWRLTCESSGTGADAMQAIVQGVPLRKGTTVALKIRVRTNKPFKLDKISLNKLGSPWNNYGNSLQGAIDVTETWSEHELLFRPNTDDENARLSFFLGGSVPDGAEFCFALGAATVREYDSLGITCDVGNIIMTRRDAGGETAGAKDDPGKSAVERFGSNKIAAFKRWSADQLKEANDYWYNKETGEVWFRSDENPASIFGELEAALKVHICRCSRYATIEDLAFGYGAAHGVAGGGSKGCIIRNCDIFWIGGGDHSAGYKSPTRFGNGVEFWDAGQDHLVEGCRFWEVYDVAMSIQGPSPSKIDNIVWRNNTVWRCEQSFEIWYSNPESEVTRILFEKNTCVDAGFGWSHEQRPNKNGTQLLAYRMDSKKIDFVIRDNIFCRGKNELIWFFNPRLAEFTLDRNVWWQPEENGIAGIDQPLFRWDPAKQMNVAYEKYREMTGHDRHSLFVEPVFADPDKHDYRVKNRAALHGAGAD